MASLLYACQLRGPGCRTVFWHRNGHKRYCRVCKRTKDLQLKREWWMRNK